MFDYYRKELTPDLLLLVLVHNNTLYWLEGPEGPAQREVPRIASPYKQLLHKYMTTALARRRLSLPNVLFIYNTFDNGNRIGKPTRNLTAPAFSVCKSRGWYDGDDLDILVPQMMAIPDALHSVPWHLKRDLAFFRGVPSCSRIWEQTYKREEACSRMHLAYLSERDRRAGNATALDVGLADEYKVVGPLKSTPYELPKFDRLPLSTHAHYKWLLNLEGVVAAYRMGQLLSMNSLVLHQRSYFIEYFYRSLQPWVHYVPFWNATGPDGEPVMDDVYHVLDDVRRLDQEQPAALQRIIANAQGVAKLLSKAMRLEYYKAALEGYKALFPDMDAFVESFVQSLRSKGSMKEEWEAFLKDNLEQDIKPWQDRAPLKAEEIFRMFAYFRDETRLAPDLMQLVLVYNNTLYWVYGPDGQAHREVPEVGSQYMHQLHRHLARALRAGRLQLPNVVFIYNTDDNGIRIARPTRNITVPPFSLCKSQGWFDGDDLDILVPQMIAIPDALHIVPWHLKKDLAFFRGVPSCSRIWERTYKREEACSRMHLAYLSERDRRAGNATALDVGLMDEYREVGPLKSTPYELPKFDRLPLSTHAHYKWLLNLEGVVAAYRMGQLLSMNSLVLHQRSYFIEYFYRSLQPWVHYVPFWNATGPDGEPVMDDVYHVLDDVRRLDQEQPAALQRIIANAQGVAKLLGRQMRLEYYKEAIEKYRALFPDMDAFVETFVQSLRSKGSKIP
ncbi:hypothetical protein HXX76_010946 [Chlamydomonas incerta]|uniref:Glycosyl transferase CAP10 domain-containing protein n=1 Tax=Chlamydomonas incerta TaxID=51695 RepID=A0A835VRJ1_CHLIN|nr:hypothetical protein HXX76_010946 [Chlamydomonas incerta]|eukprot:KAG2423178.1 hypothetical protein HXX76_010946 [Chlamydomonas incerta]